MIANAFGAGFHRIVHRALPTPVGSSDRVTRYRQKQTFQRGLLGGEVAAGLDRPSVAGTDWLGFDVVADPVFRDLVIARIVEPTRKLDSLRVLADLGAELVSYKTIDRHVRKIHTSGHRDAVAEKCFAYASDCGGLSLLLYDVTTLYLL